MEYTTEIIIEQPIDTVVALFSDPTQMGAWQPAFVRMEHQSGEPGQTGAQAKLVYKRGKGTMEMTETIVTSNLPEEFTAQYETGSVLNTMRNQFYAEGGHTRWVTHNTFEFSGVMVLLGLLMPKQFRKQTQADMERFKAYAESL